MRVLTAASTLKNRWFSHLDDRFPSGSYDLNSRAQNLLRLAWKTSSKKGGLGSPGSTKTPFSEHYSSLKKPLQEPYQEVTEDPYLTVEEGSFVFCHGSGHISDSEVGMLLGISKRVPNKRDPNLATPPCTL